MAAFTPIHRFASESVQIPHVYVLAVQDHLTKLPHNFLQSTLKVLSLSQSQHSPEHLDVSAGSDRVEGS